MAAALEQEIKSRVPSPTAPEKASLETPWEDEEVWKLRMGNQIQPETVSRKRSLAPHESGDFELEGLIEEGTEKGRTSYWPEPRQTCSGGMASSSGMREPIDKGREKVYLTDPFNNQRGDKSAVEGTKLGGTNILGGPDSVF